jgi:hypothetical protein
MDCIQKIYFLYLPNIPLWLKRYIVLASQLGSDELAKITDTTETVVFDVNLVIEQLCSSAIKWLRKEQENADYTQVGLCKKKDDTIVQKERYPSIFDEEEERNLYAKYKKILEMLNCLKGVLQI